MTVEQLARWVHDARERSVELVADLTDEQLMGPRLAIVNPLLWEIGHVAWFQEKWVLRHLCKEEPIRADADALWDSIAIPHDVRWDLPLPPREEILAYMRGVRDRVVERLGRPDPGEDLLYFVRYTVLHEDMHTEAFTYTRQTLGYPPPPLSPPGDEVRVGAAASAPAEAGHPGGEQVSADVEIPGGTFLLGATRDAPFVFDNEKWAQPVEVKPFAIARTAVTQGEFAAFVDDGGYARREWWSDEGWRWRESTGLTHPLYWRCDSDGSWFRRHFNAWLPLEPELPVIHVSWYEAEAFCRWAGRRLLTEAEWECAAAVEAEPGAGKLSGRKRAYPWGDELPTAERANLDWRAMGCMGVYALPEGDSAFGCRQMIGNVWEWTSTPFLPYPGFVPDAYREYSEPWFGTRMVLRGGCWTTRSRLVRNTYRNFYTPDRRDVFAGFRTCAPET